jgi:hypothetical protein
VKENGEDYGWHPRGLGGEGERRGLIRLQRIYNF